MNSNDNNRNDINNLFVHIDGTKINKYFNLTTFFLNFLFQDSFNQVISRFYPFARII